jgi:hypothetical protein
MTRRQTHPSIAATLGVATAALALAGCGGSTNNTSSTSNSASSPPPNGVPAAVYQYPRCMRTHGVTNFPDPVVHQNGGNTQVAMVINKSITAAPAFKSARSYCQRYLPRGGNGPELSPQQEQARKLGMISFAQCMHAHGVSSFPDPTAQGQLTLPMIAAAHIDIAAPSIQNIARNCAPASHGLLTVGDINRALARAANGASGNS